MDQVRHLAATGFGRESSNVPWRDLARVGRRRDPATGNSSQFFEFSKSSLARGRHSVKDFCAQWDTVVRGQESRRGETLGVRVQRTWSAGDQQLGNRAR